MVRPSQRKTPLTVEFGARVLRSRQAIGLTQEAVAHATSLSWTYVASLERGERNVTITTLVRLAETLNVAPSELVDGLPSPEPLGD